MIWQFIEISYTSFLEIFLFFILSYQYICIHYKDQLKEARLVFLDCNHFIVLVLVSIMILPRWDLDL